MFICRFVPTMVNRRINEIGKDIKSSLKDMINKRVKILKEGGENKNDLLGILIETNHKEIKEHGNNVNVGMNIEDVIQECKLFYFAGQETTSTLLVWTMVLLSRYPEWQARAREEVLQIFGNKKPNFDGLNNLKIVSIYCVIIFISYEFDFFFFFLVFYLRVATFVQQI